MDGSNFTLVTCLYQHSIELNLCRFIVSVRV